MTHLSISLLGSFEVRLGDEPVTDFGYDKVRALLAYLVVEAARAHRREHLVGVLWPDHPGDKGFVNLRVALYHLRNALGDRRAHPPYLSVSRDTLQINPASDIRLDAQEFSNLVAATSRHAHPSLDTCADCIALMTRAADLYRGDFLQGFSLDSTPFEDWAVVQREALHLQALEVLDRLTELHANAGDHDLALTYARRQVALEPWRETAHRQAMRALALSGQRAAALAQYETCRQVLADELGVEPEAETVALYETIRAGPLAASSPGATPPVGSTARSGSATRAGPAAPDRSGDGARDEADFVRAVPPEPVRAPVREAPVETPPATQALPAASAPPATQPLPAMQPLPGARAPSVLQAGDLAVLEALAELGGQPSMALLTVRRAERLGTTEHTGHEGAATAAAQAAVDLARAAGDIRVEALGHLYAGVVLRHAAGSGFQASLSHFGRALSLARSTRMSSVEAEALRYLGSALAADRQEEGFDALSKSLALFRELHDRNGEARVLLALAFALFQAGSFEAAWHDGRKGLEIAREIGDRRTEGWLCRTLGLMAMVQGRYGDSMRYLHTALACFREVAEPAGGAAALQALAWLLDQLGAYARAWSLLLRSVHTPPEHVNPADVLMGRVLMALIRLHRGDAIGAYTYAAEVLDSLDALGDAGEHGFCPLHKLQALVVVGHALALRGRAEDAAAAYRRALGVDLKAGWPAVTLEPRMGLLALGLRHGDGADAVAEVAGVLAHLETAGLAGTLEPLRAYLIAYRVLAAQGLPQARDVLIEGHRILMARAGTLDDDDLRASYLQNVAANRDLLTTYAARIEAAPDPPR